MNKTISEQTREILADCVEQGLAIRRIGTLAGMAPTTLHRFARGESGISTECLDHIGEVLGFRVTADRKAIARLAAESPRAGRPRVRPSNAARTKRLDLGLSTKG